jgi:hypothetical protein
MLGLQEVLLSMFVTWLCIFAFSVRVLKNNIPTGLEEGLEELAKPRINKM